ncbi:hypothetical protein [Flammeovirga agarivorans]|uniref:Cytochrome c domain-containing protein n=1 Tax=Flammeovirga agarivorans TaxID=2726742 RepID=A0A7X8XVW8_9BACT|nr:hypothetical protein [Flammeovirga agarivorans]NLR91743.1 hypothetical protein [Flammeovirga agarivorans]
MKIFFLLSFGALSFLFASDLENNWSRLSHKSIPSSESNSLKEKAFEVLNTKCNVCHVKKNRRKIFTPDNMDRFGPQINTQVFIKKRMPKGNSISLSSTEYKTLKNWLNTLQLN